MAVLEGGAADGAGVARQLAALEVLGGRVRAVAAHCPRAHPVAAVAAPSGAAAAAKGEVIPRGGGATLPGAHPKAARAPRPARSPSAGTHGAGEAVAAPGGVRSA
eukprot:CAMPEP_0180313360 /NCGR_PEP_ID=MMETSP0988-20121125/31363_1 /TAXON_ID=697907 /ORGANISM="non described non described, Strain CCMP2293" /LENGTH=104 /DNA_ID=CAMNT_0022297745 /DNA_START=12 /DNA_END=323 /DNA_ORIENTATION=+